MVNNHKDTMTKTGAMLHFRIVAAGEMDVRSSMRAMQYEKLLPRLKKLLSILPTIWPRHAIINYLKSFLCVGVGVVGGFVGCCFVISDCSVNVSTFLLLSYLLIASTDDGNFLLAAWNGRRPTCIDDIISLNADDVWKGSTTYIGNLRSNFRGTKFTIYDVQSPNVGSMISKSPSIRRLGSRQVSLRVLAGNYLIGHISYELNVLGTRGPRIMQCVMNTIPANAIEPGGVAHT
ncbi:Tubby-like F-box protein 3 [Vitis vinifera]|uniref:Tubby-like F-box protein 3 n=1 Tax=Vitis vinifera TaxID=29760 RepID=A0A438CK56_VITVI|nr:Tubby-like F-box protein 3 [Vitis vinifera]